MEIAGIILAGGLGSRMGYTAKGRMLVCGQPIIERLLGVYAPLFDEVHIACRSAEDYADTGYPLALDRYDARSSLTGIHAGLSCMEATHGFFAACDAPFLQTGLVSRLLEFVQPEDDVVIPLKEDGYREPLCAVYSKRCLPHIDRQLQAEDYKIIRFFDHVRVREVPVAELQTGDPDLVSFFNVNRPEELKAAQDLCGRLEKESGSKGTD